MTTSTTSALTYTVQPAIGGGFLLTSNAGTNLTIKTLKLAKSYVEFAGAALIVLDKTGKPKN